MKMLILNQMKDIRDITVKELVQLPKSNALEKVATSQVPVIAKSISPPPKGLNDNMTSVETPPVGNHEEVGFQELISESQLTEQFVKSCSRRNLAVRMVCILLLMKKQD